jgi:long-chain acyl-CoA synthetase
VTSGPDGNFAARLAAAARRRPEQPALVWEDGALSWRELEARAGGVARWLARDGVGRGDVVALLLPNGWGFAAALWGGLALGATVAPLNPLLAGEERARILEHLAPKRVIDAVPAAEPAALPAGADGAAPAVVLYTSGSTGRPKGAVLSHAALIAANESWAGPVMALSEADRVLAALPLAHSFGLNGALLAPLLAGAAVVLQERFSPEETLGAIGRHRVTVFPGVATMFSRILESAALAAADLSSLRLAVSGAAPCPWPLAREWRRRTGVRIVRGYGMTELFRPVSYLAAEPADLPDSVGRAVPGVRLRLEDGELWIRTPAMMDGYLRAPEETAAVIEDGWFKTGDLATISADGFVSIVGRKRELILRGGYSVVPAEVEAVLLGHPAVAEAAVVGIAHPELGEEVAAFVILRPGASVGPEELIAFSRGRLAGYKYPRRITLVAELPRSATGKILKASLRER